MNSGERIDLLVGDHAAKLSERLMAHRTQLFPPHARKSLRRFSSGEVAGLLGVKDAYLRKLSLEGRGPQPETGAGGRRLYSSEDIRALRQMLEQGAKAPGTYVPGRRAGDHLQVVTVINFKGGSGKTTTAAHLAQKCALDGYRVLAIDLDPQASLSALHGFQPEFDLADGGTLYDAIRYDAPVPFAEVVRKTYFHNLDLAPAGLLLAEFETETAHALHNNLQPPFYQRLALCISEVEASYDVVVIDCPPQLGFITLSALVASTGLVVTVVPSMLDVASMAQFLQLASSLMATIADVGATPEWDFMKFLITRFEPNDGPQTQMAAFLRTMFGDDVLTRTFLKSSAVSDAGLTQQTLFEVSRTDFTRQTYDRAIESISGVVSEIEGLIQSAWNRKEA